MHFPDDQLQALADRLDAHQRAVRRAAREERIARAEWEAEIQRQLDVIRADIVARGREIDALHRRVAALEARAGGER